MKRSIRSIPVLLIVLFTLPAYGQVKLPRLVSDGMVLQRDASVKIWGWASPGEMVTVKFNQGSYTDTTGREGRWEITLPPMKAGGPYEMEIAGSNQIDVENILIGDLWICSGQSNMELTMKRAAPLYEKVIAQSENPAIRYFNVPDRYDFNRPREDLGSGSWQAANPENIVGFSATAYFFARALYKKYRVPIGLVNASLGGSPVQAWISEDALKAFPEDFKEAQKFKDSKLIARIKNQEGAIRDTWYRRLWQRDEGYKNRQMPWYHPDYDASQWPAMDLPGDWADEAPGQINGVVWFRKQIDVPASMAGKPTKLLLGRIVDSDSVYVNGVFVGSTGYQYPPRRYKVPAGILRQGKNTLVVRVINNRGRGGFVKDKPYQLTAGGKTIDLAGKWQYQVGATMDPLPGQTFIRWKPVGLYNGMIAPLLNLSIKGVIWYQGAANARDPEGYRELFAALIHDWRQKWEQGNFPFLYVQLANYMEAKDSPSESNWAELREAQLQTLSVPHTGMAVAIDLGEWNDIHPLNKQDVGARLALAARKVAYGENIVYSGPVYESMEVAGDKLVLSFSNTGSGLEARGGGGLKHFAIAGPDKKFVWAEAKIKGNTVVVWHKDISNPVAVRYAWADNPAGANLYNKEGLPASPFRTDRSFILAK